MEIKLKPAVAVGAFLGVITIGSICSIFTLLSVNTLFGTTLAISIENVAATTWLYIMFASAIKGLSK